MSFTVQAPRKSCTFLACRALEIKSLLLKSACQYHIFQRKNKTICCSSRYVMQVKRTSNPSRHSLEVLKRQLINYSEFLNMSSYPVQLLVHCQLTSFEPNVQNNFKLFITKLISLAWKRTKMYKAALHSFVIIPTRLTLPKNYSLSPIVNVIQHY